MRNNDFAASRGRFISDPGSSIKILYDPVLNEDQTITLVATGKVDIQEEIDSFAESVALETLINRFVNGENDALNRYKTMYLDLTQFPKTYADAMQSMVNAERGFDALPTDLKKNTIITGVSGFLSVELRNG